MPVIFDEVFCGLWRLGVASTRELLGEDPDVSCYAKLLTGGLVPMSATIATERVFDSFSGAKVVVFVPCCLLGFGCFTCFAYVRTSEVICILVGVIVCFVTSPA